MALSGMLPLLTGRREFLVISEQLEAGARPWVIGPGGAAKAFVLAGLITRLSSQTPSGRTPAWFMVTPGRDQAEKLADDLAAFLPPGAGELHLLTPWESFNPEDRPTVEGEGARQRVLDSLRRGGPQVIVTSAAGALSPVANPRWVDTVRVAGKAGSRVDLEEVVRRLAGAGYERTDLVQRPGEMAVRGGLIDVYPSTDDHPVRIEWVGDEIESVRVFDPESQRTVRERSEITILPARAGGEPGVLLPDLVPDAVWVLDEPDELERQARSLYEQAAAAHRRAEEAERISPAPPIPFATWDELAARLGARRSVAMSTLHRPPRGEAVEILFGAVESFAGQMEGLTQQLREWVAAGRRIVV